jgi:hypothetical protein
MRDDEYVIEDFDDKEVDSAGNTRWFTMGVCSRLEGLPAAEYADGSKAWYVMGFQHRDGDLPAVELIDGTKEWWINGAWIRTLTEMAALELIRRLRRENFCPR